VCTFVEQAEASHKRKARKKALAQQQGEGTWMLQSVDERIRHEEEVMKQKQHCIQYRSAISLFSHVNFNIKQFDIY